MEVRKANQQIIQTEIPQKSEVTKTKNDVQKLISDSFEKENSKSSSSNSSSTASSEPEKKVGQITNGILIKQMTAARIGETNAKQSGEVSGKKDLSPEQQASVSNSDPQKKNLNSTFLLQDARSKDEDRKNSGLQPPFGSQKGAVSEQQSRVNQSKDQAKDLIGQDTKVHDGSQKDFSNDPVVNGTKLNDAVQNAVDARKKDTDAVAGRSGSDQLTALLDPTAAGPQQSASATGKDQIAYETQYDVHNNDGTTTHVKERAGKDRNDQYFIHQEQTIAEDGHILGSHLTVTELYDDNTKVVTDITSDLKTSTTVETTIKDGTITEKTTVQTYDPFGPTKTGPTTVKTTNKDGTTTTTTEPAGGAKSYDQEHYSGNIPDEVKKTMEYFKQQAISQKPSTGGETAHTDDNAEADPTVGGRVSNLVAQQGNLGLLGDPGNPEIQTGAGGSRGPVGSSQSGGNVDFDQDSGKSGYTGPTHQDNPGDVQFGSQEPVVKDAVESKNSDGDSKDSNDLTNILDRKRRRSVN